MIVKILFTNRGYFLMKKNKLITLIIAGVMTLSVLSACGKKEETTTPVVTPPVVTPEKVTADYTAEAPAFDERGWKATLTVTYEDDKIVKVVYDEVNKDGLKKSEDTAYAKMMKDVTKISPAEAYTILTETAIKDGSVATVAGATVAAKSFGTLFEQAKAMKK
jgi:major membrane immunogen (membrane-anchored lipoprotein)